MPSIEDEAPGVRLWVSPPGDEYVERLARGLVDLVVMPKEVFSPYRDCPNLPLFSDRFVCAVDADNDQVGATVSLEEFSALPYLATSCGHEVSPAEVRLDRLGIVRNTEITTAFGLALTSAWVSASTWASSAEASTTAWTKPMRRASAASKRSAVRK